MDDQPDDEKTTEKVEKLLRKAEQTEYEHERDALIAKAQQIASTAQIQAAMARMAGRQNDKPIRQDFQMGEPGNSAFRAMARLLKETADSNDVFICAFRDTAKVWVYGYLDDIQISIVLYASLHCQMVSACEKYLSATTLNAQERLTAKRSFHTAYAERVGRLLWQAKDAAAREEATGGAALALRGKRGEVEDFYEEDRKREGIVSVPARLTGPTDPRAAAAGTAAAKNARLHANDNLTGKRLELTS